MCDGLCQIVGLIRSTSVDRRIWCGTVRDGTEQVQDVGICIGSEEGTVVGFVISTRCAVPVGSLKRTSAPYVH